MRDVHRRVRGLGAGGFAGFLASASLALPWRVAGQSVEPTTRATEGPASSPSSPATGSTSLAPDSPPDSFVPPPPTPDEVRGLPPCPPGRRFGPGEQYDCRPPTEPPGPHWQFPLELAWGGMYAGTPLGHGAIAFSTGIDVGVGRALLLGAQWRFLGGGERQGDGVQTGYYSSHLFGAAARLRLWTDETAREAWAFEAEGGYGLVPSHRHLSGPYVGVGFGRQVGTFYGPTASAQIALLLRYLKGFGEASDLHAVLLGVRLMLESGIPLPADINELPRAAPFAWTFGIEHAPGGIRFGGDRRITSLSPMLGLSVGFPVARALEPRLRLDMSYFVQAGDRDARAPLGYTGAAGLRLRLAPIVPLFVELLGGWQLVTGHRPRDHESGAVLDVAFGAMHAGCGVGFGVGLRARAGLLERNERFRAITFFVELSLGNRTAALAEAPWPTEPSDHGWSCAGPYEPGSVPRPEVPPPPPPAREPVSVPTPPAVGGRVEVDASLPTAGARVEVEVEPVRIEVSLGMALFGGLVQIRIAPDALPLEQLRHAGFVTVEIVGPPGALPRAEAELRAALGPDGARIEGWSRIESSRSDVRAIFTIWPPGTRPQR